MLLHKPQKGAEWLFLGRFVPQVLLEGSVQEIRAHVMYSLVRRRKFRGCFWQSLLLLTAKGMLCWMPVSQEASGSSQGPLLPCQPRGQLSVGQQVTLPAALPQLFPSLRGTSEAASCSASESLTDLGCLGELGLQLSLSNS